MYEKNANLSMLDKETLSEDLAMVFLEKDTPIDIFPNVGLRFGEQVENGSVFIISGFTKRRRVKLKNNRQIR